METKSEIIKIRVSKKDKEKIKTMSRLNNETLTSYLLRKGLEEDADFFCHMPDRVESCGLLNEIYHRIIMRCGRQLEWEVQAAFREALRDYGNGGFGR